LNCKFIAWRCNNCGRYQSRELRFTNEHSLAEKYKKVNLKCVYCNKSMKLKLTNQLGLNVYMVSFDDERSCMQHIKNKNTQNI